MPRKKADLRVIGLGDEELLDRLQDAAKAAGVQTVEQLVDLVVDSGVSARPPKDGLTERFTLEEMGKRLWTLATSRPRDKRAEWYAGLVPAQKIAVVVVLRHRGYSALTISNDLGLPEMQVEQIYAKNRTELGAQVLGVRLDTLVGQIWAAKERAQEMAIRKDDVATFWRVEEQSVKLLQELGVIQRAAHRVEVVDKAADVKAVMLKRLADVMEKKAVRHEELRQIKIAEVDVLPDEVTVGYEELKDV